MKFDFTKKYGVRGYDIGIGDAVIKSSFPENFYKNYGHKLIDVEKKWIYDYNPYVIRDENPDLVLDYLQNQIEIIKAGKRISHLSNAEEYCWNYNLNKCYITKPRLYKYEDSETIKDLVVVHTTGKTVGCMNDNVIDKIGKNYKNYNIVQIGGMADKPTPFKNYLNLSLWETVEIISKCAIYIGLSSSFYHVANCYPKVRKKVVLNYCDEDSLKRIYPMNYKEGCEWLEFNVEYFNNYDIDIGSTLSFNNI